MSTTAIGAYLDAVDAGAKATATSWLAVLPGYQVEERFTDFHQRCPDQVEPPEPRRRPA